MTIASNISPISSYEGNGTAYQFSYFFRALSASDVIVTAVTADVEETLVAGVDYTLTMSRFPLAGGVVSLLGIGQTWMDTDYLKANSTLLIKCNLDPAQASRFRDFGPNGPIEIEKALDRQVTFISSLKELVGRSLKIPYIGSSSVSTELPSLVGQALKLVHVNATEDGYGYDVTTAEIFAAQAAAESSATQAALSAEAAAMSEDAAEVARIAAEVAQAAAEAALVSTQAAAAQAIIDINAGEVDALAQIEAERIAALADVAASTAAAEAAVTEAEAARDLAETYRDQAAASASAAAQAIRYAFVAVQNIASGGKITLSADPKQMVDVQGNAGPQDANVLPFTAAPADGTEIILLGQDDAKILTVFHNDAAGGCLLKGDMYLGLNQSLTLVYNSTKQRYIEIARSV